MEKLLHLHIWLYCTSLHSGISLYWRVGKYASHHIILPSAHVLNINLSYSIHSFPAICWKPFNVPQVHCLPGYRLDCLWYVLQSWTNSSKNNFHSKNFHSKIIQNFPVYSSKSHPQINWKNIVAVTWDERVIYSWRGKLAQNFILTYFLQCLIGVNLYDNALLRQQLKPCWGQREREDWQARKGLTAGSSWWQKWHWLEGPQGTWLAYLPHLSN